MGETKKGGVRKHGDDPRAWPKTTLRIRPDLFDAARHRAIDDKCTFQELVGRGIELYLKTAGKEVK